MFDEPLPAGPALERQLIKNINGRHKMVEYSDLFGFEPFEVDVNCRLVGAPGRLL